MSDTPAPTDSLDDRLRSLADEALDGTDISVVDLSVRGFAGSRVVEIFVDTPDGIGVDDVATASRKISFLLDAEDPVKGHYRLDVSSPGADRPLTHPMQFPRHVGRTLRVDTGEVTLTGELTAADADGLTLSIPPKKKKDDPETVVVSFADLTSARVELPW